MPCGHHGEAVSDPQVGGLTSTAHGSAVCDDQTERVKPQRTYGEAIASQASEQRRRRYEAKRVCIQAEEGR